MGHGLEHSWVGPSCTLVKEWGEAIDAPLEHRLLSSWRRRCYLGSMALPGVRSTWNNYKQRHERSKQQLKLALKHRRKEKTNTARWRVAHGDPPGVTAAWYCCSCYLNMKTFLCTICSRITTWRVPEVLSKRDEASVSPWRLWSLHKSITRAK